MLRRREELRCFIRFTNVFLPVGTSVLVLEAVQAALVRFQHCVEFPIAWWFHRLSRSSLRFSDGFYTTHERSPSGGSAKEVAWAAAVLFSLVGFRLTRLFNSLWF